MRTRSAAMQPTPLINVLWLVGERVARVGLTATVFALVARHLTPPEFAYLNLALTVTAMVAALANFGLEGLVVHELVRRPAMAGTVLGTAFRLRLAAGTSAFVVVAALGFLVPDWRPALVPVLLAGSTLLLNPVEVIDLLFQRHLESRRTVIVRFTAVVLGALLRLALIGLDAPVSAFAAAQLFETAVYGGLLAASLRRSGLATGTWMWDPALARHFIRRGAPLALSGIVVALALRLDQLLVLSWLGERSAGVYFASAKLIEVTLLAGTAFTLSLFPRLAEFHPTTPAFREQLQALFDALSAIGWVVALGATVSAPWLIPLLFGDAYRAGVPVLIVQGWGALAALNAAARWQYILVAAPTALNLGCAFVGVAVQLALAPWLLSRLGIIGAALGWTIAVIVSGCVTSFFFSALRPVAGAQWSGLLIPFAPRRWPALLAQFR